MQRDSCSLVSAFCFYVSFTGYYLYVALQATEAALDLSKVYQHWSPKRV